MAGKLRSPNYPALSLPQALEGAGKLWNAEKRTPVGHEAAALALGFKSLSGPARVMIGALRQYGFIVKAEKGQIRLSDLAVAVLHGSPDDKRTAMRQATVNPPLFKELAQDYSDASETAISSYLITKKAFAEDGARKAAKAFRATLKLAKPDASGYTPDDSRKEPENMQGTDTGQNFKDTGSGTPGGIVKGQPEQEVLQQRVAPDCVARVLFQGRVTQEAVDKLVAYLNLMRDTLPSGKGHLAQVADAFASR
jgi:hypothetical protein